MKRISQNRRSGFTLIELVVVLVIIGVVMTGLSLISNRSSPTAAHEAATRFQAAYQAARAEAIATGRWAIVAIRVDPATDSLAGRSGRYTAAVVDDPATNPSSFVAGAWTPLEENVTLDPGAATTGPMPGSGAAGGYSRDTFTCRTTCDLGGDSFVTVFFRPADDDLSVWAVLVSQSGQARVFKYNPTGVVGTSDWQ